MHLSKGCQYVNTYLCDYDGCSILKQYRLDKRLPNKVAVIQNPEDINFEYLDMLVDRGVSKFLMSKAIWDLMSKRLGSPSPNMFDMSYCGIPIEIVNLI